ncbi:hypothetical protein [Methylopila turkensis]|uniref:Uncharacterized protein n=1 Tax=Methylopila turkensis TaxID=1437816 RepID=A0A9W6JLA5_9HYPH|nr:hypothetical protein [Methylopila turkensis]GLK78486.1 hypothetical protein GCM10008174_02270 [Methylopila turkensis]
MYELKILYSTFFVKKASEEGHYIATDKQFDDLIAIVESKSSQFGGENIDSNSLGEHTNTIGIHDKHRLNYPQEVQEFINNYGYIFAGSAAFAVFLRNASGALKDIIEILRKNGGHSSVVVSFKGEKITIRNGDDLEKIISKLPAD